MSTSSVSGSSITRPRGHLGTMAQLALLAGCAVVASVGLALSGSLSLFPIVALAVLLYLPAIYLTSRTVEGPRPALDRLMTAVVTAFFLLALIPLISITWTVVSNGYHRIDPGFFVRSLKGVLDTSDDSTAGGARHAILGSLIVTGITTVLAVPLGLLAAIYLVEYGVRSRLARALTFFVDVMTGIPSIVAGLFAVALFAIVVGPSYKAGIMG